jgi:hypothetical protein
MDVLSIASDDLLINRVHYTLYGPGYWIDGRWSAYQRGRDTGKNDPDFTLLRHDDRRRQGSHAAYQKAAAVIAAAANQWMPTEVDLARLVVESLEWQLSREVVTLAEWYSFPPRATCFDSLVKVRENYLAQLGAYLEVARRIIKRSTDDDVRGAIR